MKKYLKYLKNHYVAYLLILVIGFLSSFVTCYFINNGRAYYEASFIVENIESFDDSKLVDNDFLNEIKDPKMVEQKISNITAIVISKMSKKLVSSFYSVYKKNKNSENEELYEYVARHIFFFIRKINFELTELFTTMTDTPALEIVKGYAIRLEEEIYEINNIDILDINKDESDNKIKE